MPTAGKTYPLVVVWFDRKVKPDVTKLHLMDQTVTLPQPSGQQFAPAKQVQRAKIQNPQSRKGSGNHKREIKKKTENHDGYI